MTMTTHNPKELLLQAKGLQAWYGAAHILFDITLQVKRGEVVALMGQIGSGSLPVERLPSAGLALAPAGGRRRGAGSELDELARVLRALPMPVIGRIADDRLLLDLRCLEEATLLTRQLAMLRAALQGVPPGASAPAANPTMR